MAHFIIWEVHLSIFFNYVQHKMILCPWQICSPTEFVEHFSLPNAFYSYSVGFLKLTNPTISIVTLLCIWLSISIPFQSSVMDYLKRFFQAQINVTLFSFISVICEPVLTRSSTVHSDVTHSVL